MILIGVLVCYISIGDDFLTLYPVPMIFKFDCLFFGNGSTRVKFSRQIMTCHFYPCQSQRANMRVLCLYSALFIQILSILTK
jgi:hypothetical protein